MVCTQLQEHWTQCQQYRHGKRELALHYFADLKVNPKNKLATKAFGFMSDLPRIIVPPLRRT